MQRREMRSPLLGVVADYFKVLSEPLRLKILNSLRDGERSVGEIVKRVESSQPNVSKHLNILIKMGFVARRREKNTVFYTIADRRIWQICEIACGLDK